MVHVVNVVIGERVELAAVFEDLIDAYGYLTNNNLVGTVESMELIKKTY